MHFSSGIVLSALPSITFFTGLTISALHSGGRSFWEVLKDQREFDLCKQSLMLDQVEFSYTESFSRNFSHLLWTQNDSTDVLIRGIIIRLRHKGPAVVKNMRDRAFIRKPSLQGFEMSNNHNLV
jgi:hypothetical protein